MASNQRPGNRNTPGGSPRDPRHGSGRSQRPDNRPAPPRDAKPPAPQRTPLPMAQIDEPEDDLGLVYFAYGEKGDDVAFEMCEGLEEALGVYQIMTEDGFEPRLFQATEIQVVPD